MLMSSWNLELLSGYMSKFGLDRVRGGFWCSIELSDENKEDIENMIKDSGSCYLCHSPDHFYRDCEMLHCFLCGGNHLQRYCQTVKCWHCDDNHERRDCPLLQN